MNAPTLRSDVPLFYAYGQRVVGTVWLWGRLPTERWHPCENPERPVDARVAFHQDGCTGCTITAQAYALQHPGSERAAELVRLVLVGS